MSAEPRKISGQGDEAAQGPSFTYDKWEALDEEQLVDQDIGSGNPSVAPAPTSFDPGQPPFAIKDVDYVSTTSLGENTSRVLKLPQAEQEVWQIVIRKLRVWSAASTGADEGQDAIPCRPYCIMINSLYPTGKVLFQTLCDPPEEKPSPETILRHLVTAMLKPNAGEQRRPSMLTFVDAETAGELFQSLAKWKIQGSQLSEAEGVDELVRRFSELLIQNKFASVGNTSELPGRLEQHGVSVSLLRALHNAAATFSEREPWSRIHERKAFKVKLEKPVSIVSDNPSAHPLTVEPCTVWVSVLGYDAYLMMKETGKGRAGNGAFGVAVFFSKLDLESRLVPPQEELFIAPPGASQCSYCGLTEREIGHELKRTKPRKMDIRTGEELLYRDTDALRAHWPKVRKYAVELSELEKGRASRREHWLGKECTVLFENPTSIPFDDLDVAAKHDLAIGKSVESLGPCTYPLSLQFIKGTPERPEASQLVWLEFALKLSLEMLERGLAESALIDPDTPVTITSEAVVEGEVTFKVTPSPVYFKVEAEAAAMRKPDTKVAAKATTEDSEEGPTSGDSSGKPSKEEGDEETITIETKQSGCIIA
mmetsp:Transcript_16448/g.30109  ORF Transcript_16448/g.30109 Transcript_16448/m.30109 type:complete len:594 (+) Transcript_16448:2753-4534(+)